MILNGAYLVPLDDGDAFRGAGCSSAAAGAPRRDARGRGTLAAVLLRVLDEPMTTR